jgi:hypothetical protein
MIQRLTVVDSSMIHAIGYDRAARTMEVVFRDGGIYEYLDVPRGVYTGLMAADSKGHFMQQNVLNEYRSRRLSRGHKRRRR